MDTLIKAIWNNYNLPPTDAEQIVNTAMDLLSFKEQETLRNYYHRQMTMKEIAMQQQCAVSTVSKQLHKAIFLLRQQLNPASFQPMYDILYPMTKKPVPFSDISSASE